LVACTCFCWLSIQALTSGSLISLTSSDIFSDGGGAVSARADRPKATANRHASTIVKKPRRMKALKNPTQCPSDNTPAGHFRILYRESLEEETADRSGHFPAPPLGLSRSPGCSRSTFQQLPAEPVTCLRRHNNCFGQLLLRPQWGRKTATRGMRVGSREDGRRISDG
jgi:hypothetical protein